MAELVSQLTGWLSYGSFFLVFAGSFAIIVLGLNLQWQLGHRQELRVKLEAIALDARLRQAWQVGPGGRPVPTGESIPDFSLANLGFQVRYRYELAPLSDLYVVYGRGGGLLEDGSRPLAELLGDATSLRDAEQLLVKLSYRFAN